ncbi:hypothetical protein OC846_002133 [Tilletia horrida]|uniref:CAP-Gly domain-containing protein n=1 Tax=Tilletia horrida TaxID=155126 RepID=A0AAN6GRR3_9BASI|nr:hypothetical protein OC846_002133 [Tilletia horrida]KAK0570206.1 hypothetical protein OC861_000155 [Tilletia horrida]
MSRPSLGSSTNSPAGASRLARPSLGPRKSLIALRQTAAATAASSSTGGTSSPVPPLPSSPSLASSVASTSSSVSSPAPQQQQQQQSVSLSFQQTAPFTPARPRLGTTSSSSPKLDIGDVVSIDLPGGNTLTGVLRHLGPVHFKDGIYAGLELIGDSEGKGKNNGEVQGRQYFATRPNNGMFCLASKVVKISQEPAVDAVARPESAMSASSQRSQSRAASRLSEASNDRPVSRISIGPSSNAVTPARSNLRARSNTTSSSHLSDAAGGSRPSSRASIDHAHQRVSLDGGERPYGISTPGPPAARTGLPAKTRTPSSSTTTPGSKLALAGRRSFGFGGASAGRGSTPAPGTVGGPPPLPRPPSSLSHKSRASSRASALEDDQAEADSERRAKSSAEAAARAEGKIRPGSRAHRFLGMRARDLTAVSGPSDSVFGGASAKPRQSGTGLGIVNSAGRASPTKGRPSSPLKATLLGRPSLGASAHGAESPTPALSGLEALRKARASLPGGSAVPSNLPASNSSGSINNTPRPVKGRQSLLSHSTTSSSASAAAAMPPPPSPSKMAGITSRSASAASGTVSLSPTRSFSGANAAGGGSDGDAVSDRPLSAQSNDSNGRSPAKGSLQRAALTGWAGAAPRTPIKGSAAGNSVASPTSNLRPPLRPSLGSSFSSGASYMTAASNEDTAAKEDDESKAGDTSLVRRHRLLEEMDLTPKRNSAALTHASTSGAAPRSSSRLSVSDLGVQGSTSPGPDFVAQASVPLSLYEEAQQEIERLTASLAEAEQKTEAERAARSGEDRVLRAALDTERARVKEEKDEWEEDRRILKADEERRKREAEKREKELKDQVDQLKKDIEVNKDLPRQFEALKAELSERDKLADELKRTIEERDQGKAEESGKVRIAEAEMKRVEEKLKRVEADRDTEVSALQKEIEDLKAAGTEMLQLFDTRVQELRDELREDIETEYREDMRKTLRDLAAVEAERDALVSKREAEDEQRLLGNGHAAGMPATAVTIENENLREQLSHLQEKLGSLEEELALANAQADTEREAIQQKGQRSAENEANLKAEIKKYKAEVDRVSKEERAARQRIDDLNDVVEESKNALENERAEVERLRADLLSASGANPGNSTAGAGAAPTLQDEAMQERAKRAEAEKAKLEVEVERINRLLEGARSGKKEAARMVEELKKSVDEKVDLIEDVRRELGNVEAEKAALEQQLAQSSNKRELDGGAVLVRSLRRTIDDKNKEVEMLKRTHMPLPDQLLELRKIHSEEMSSKDEELRKLRSSLAAAKAAKKISDTQNAERQALHPVVGQQPSSASGENQSNPFSGYPGAKETERPLSISSIASRQSRGSVSETASLDHRSDNHMVANQVSGLNYLVRQLTDENAKVKSQFRLLEQQSKDAVEDAKSEARASSLALEALKKDVSSLQAGDSSAVDLVQLRTEFSQQTAALEKKIREAAEEISQLKADNKAAVAVHKQTLDAQAHEISNLEHLVESQIYKLDESDEMYSRLQRKLERANAYIDELRAQLDSGSGTATKTPARKFSASDSASIDTAREEEPSPSQTQALRLGKTSSQASASLSSEGEGHRRTASTASTSSFSASMTPMMGTSSDSADTPKSAKSGHADMCDDEDDEDALENFCVLCNTRGHSVVNCTSDLVQPGAGLAGSHANRGNTDDDDDVCDDCGEKGHKLEDCPYADVF